VASARLEPATDRSLVWQVLRGKSCFEVALFPGDDHERHERNGWNERNQQRETVDEKGETARTVTSAPTGVLTEEGMSRIGQRR
jgi:hypothetical protein